MGKKIDRNTILRDYSELKQLALACAEKKDFDKAIFYIERAAILMYNSNIIYVDYELENILHNISDQILINKTTEQQQNNRIAFYDYFVLDNRGLTEQYLEALASFDYEVLFIGCRCDDKSKEIYKKLKKNNIDYKIVLEKDDIKKSRIIYQLISDFSPKVIIAHTSPWDVAGLIAINAFKDSCRRYLINITDHAFWLGATVFDYFFEFRDYGYNISKEYRKINETKLLKLPYYPIINTSVLFQGFDFATEGKKLILSGGSIYKIQGSNTFLEIVKYILDTYDDAIFLFLGSGDTSVLERFVNQNNYQNRFYCRRERKDIYEVFKHCYFYLNTYPLVGGLMTQYACVAGKLPLSLNDFDEHSDNCVSELLIDGDFPNIQFSNVNELKKKIDIYMTNPQLLYKDCEKIKNAVITSDKFNIFFHEYIEADLPKSVVVFNSYAVDIYKFAEQYMARFNENKGMSYYQLFVDRKLRTLSHFPGYYIKLAKNRILQK